MDDHPCRVGGQVGVPCQIGLGRRAQATQKCQDDPLVELADLDRIAALAGCALAQRYQLPSTTAAGNVRGASTGIMLQAITNVNN